ncbi:MAG: hypothetical protein ACKV2T_04650 [Kofleriaceae bacterium]
MHGPCHVWGYLGCLLVIAGCFPNVSQGYKCATNEDCDPKRVCAASGFCVLEAVDAGTSDPRDGAIDTMLVDSAPMPDAAPIMMTFNIVATDCDGSRCKGGYDGVKQPTDGGTANTAKLCADRQFPTAIDFTINSNTPGGRFCTWAPGTMTWGCDGSCSGCNPIATVTCSNP